MAVYKIIGKPHVRATMREEHAVDLRGNPYVVVHAGEPERLAVGTLVEDITPDELAAFPDRFELVPDEVFARAARSHHAAPVAEKAAEPVAGKAPDSDEGSAESRTPARRH